MSAKQETILRYSVYGGAVRNDLLIEQRDSGRVYLIVRVGEGADPPTEVELTPGLLQELRRALVKLA